MTYYTDLSDIPGGYDIVVMDPPWDMKTNSKAKPGRNAKRHYDAMTDGEVMALPMRQILAKDSLLFLWSTVPMLARVMPIPRAWGCRYASYCEWDKGRRGTGFWWQNEHEPCLLYRRGTFRRPDGKAPFNWSIIREPRREHSRKPDFLYAEIERAWPEARKLEMFARTERPGWDGFGNEVIFEGVENA